MTVRKASMKFSLLLPLPALLLTQTFLAQPRPLNIQGHRGCRGLMPENTIPAMR